jgi:hypothetical protein
MSGAQQETTQFNNVQPAVLNWVRANLITFRPLQRQQPQPQLGAANNPSSPETPAAVASLNKVDTRKAPAMAATQANAAHALKEPAPSVQPYVDRDRPPNGRLLIIREINFYRCPVNAAPDPAIWTRVTPEMTGADLYREKFDTGDATTALFVRKGTPIPRTPVASAMQPAAATPAPRRAEVPEQLVKEPVKDAATLAQLKQEEKERKNREDAELKAKIASVEGLLKPFGTRKTRDKMCDDALMAMREIDRQDQNLLEQLQKGLAEIGGFAAQMTGWPEPGAVAALNARLAGALSRAEVLRAQATCFLSGQKSAADHADQQRKGYVACIDDYRTTLVDGGRDGHPNWDALMKESDAANGKRNEMAAIRDRHSNVSKAVELKLAQFSSYMTAVQQALVDPDRQRIQAGFRNIQTAVMIKQQGIRFQDVRFENYNDTKRNPQASQDEVGKGACNTLDKLVYEDGSERFFKPTAITDKPQEDGADPLRPLGIDRWSPRYANRNIASSAVSTALGVPALPETCIAIHNGKIGLLMRTAAGKAPAHIENSKWIFDKQWEGALSPQQEASLHAGLNALEWCDVLTGQADRHAGNYHVKVEADHVKVTGIDNDRAFGANQSKVIEPKDGVLGFNSIGTPILIDRAIHDKIVSGEFAGSALQGIDRLLTDQERQAAADRFEAVRTAVRNMDARFIVGNWTDWRSPDADQLTATQYLAAKGNKCSLFGRDFAVHFAQPAQPAAPANNGGQR